MRSTLGGFRLAELVATLDVAGIVLPAIRADAALVPVTRAHHLCHASEGSPRSARARGWPFRVGRQDGFTLIELMITVAVVAILATIATPSMQALINGNRLRATANETIATFQSARFEAIRANRRVVVCLSTDPDAAVPACGVAGATGWIVFQDANRNGQYGAGERLIRRTRAAGNVLLTGSAAFNGALTFNADGMARDAGGNLLNAAVGVCLPTTRPRENESDVVIGSGSRISVIRKDGKGECLPPGDKP